MFDVDLAFPLSAGLVAAFNPCGFAMLPAYVSYFLGLESEEETNVAKNVVRGLMVGLTMTLGFMVVFGIIGLLTSTFVSESTISSKIGYATMGFGVLMVPLGVAMTQGYEPKVKLPRMQAGTANNQLPSVFLFGVSYAVVSVSCTIGIFLAVVAGSFTNDGIVSGTAVYLAYGAGMGLVIMVLTLGVALARNSVATNMRRALPYVNKVSGAMLTLAGVYLVIYGWWEVQVLRGNVDTNKVISLSEDLQGRLTTWVSDVGPTRLAMAVAVIIVGILTMALTKGLTKGSDRALLRGSFIVVYLLIEVGRYEFDLFVLPMVRTLADLPERIVHWFTDPLRWPVFFEVLGVAVVVAVITLVTRRILPRQSTDSEPGAGTGTATTTESEPPHPVPAEL